MNSTKIQVKVDKKIPKNAHTIFSFKIPFAIPVLDGIYRVRVGRHIAEIAVKRIQRKQVGRVEASRPFQMAFVLFKWHSTNMENHPLASSR